MITIISGTNRNDSNSLRLSYFYQKLLTNHGISSQVYSLCQLPQDFANANMYGERTADFQEIITDYIESVEKIVFVSPEYNGSISGVLKLFIDSIDPEIWHNKRAALVGLSAGKAGNLGGLDDLTNILHYLQIEVLSKKPKLSVFGSLVDSQGMLIEPNAIKQLEQQIVKFSTF
jgi:chromate reductase